MVTVAEKIYGVQERSKTNMRTPVGRNRAVGDTWTTASKIEFRPFSTLHYCSEAPHDSGDI
jgi:hypothetical protein